MSLSPACAFQSCGDDTNDNRTCPIQGGGVGAVGRHVFPRHAGDGAALPGLPSGKNARSSSNKLHKAAGLARGRAGAVYGAATANDVGPRQATCLEDARLTAVCTRPAFSHARLTGSLSLATRPSLPSARTRRTRTSLPFCKTVRCAWAAIDGDTVRSAMRPGAVVDECSGGTANEETRR